MLLAAHAQERIDRLRAAGLAVDSVSTRQGSIFVRLKYLAIEELDAPKVAAAGYEFVRVTFRSPTEPEQFDTLWIRDPCPHFPTEAELREQWLKATADSLRIDAGL